MPACILLGRRSSPAPHTCCRSLSLMIDCSQGPLSTHPYPCGCLQVWQEQCLLQQAVCCLGHQPDHRQRAQQQARPGHQQRPPWHQHPGAHAIAGARPAATAGAATIAVLRLCGSMQLRTPCCCSLQRSCTEEAWAGVISAAQYLRGGGGPKVSAPWLDVQVLQTVVRVPGKRRVRPCYECCVRGTTTSCMWHGVQTLTVT